MNLFGVTPPPPSPQKREGKRSVKTKRKHIPVHVCMSSVVYTFSISFSNVCTIFPVSVCESRSCFISIKTTSYWPQGRPSDDRLVLNRCVISESLYEYVSEWFSSFCFCQIKVKYQCQYLQPVLNFDNCCHWDDNNV